MAPHQSDLLRLDLRPGLHGSYCKKCDYLFDAYDTPSPMSDVLMLMKKLECPKCAGRKSVLLLMPWKYREMMGKQIADEDKREAVRQTADKYIPR